jgi:hypothetical protein
MASRTITVATIGWDAATQGPVCTLTLTYDDVTFTVNDLSGTVLDTGAGVATVDDWALMVQTPSDPGEYKAGRDRRLRHEHDRHVRASLQCGDSVTPRRTMHHVISHV